MKNIFKNKKGKYIPNRLNLTTRLDSLYGEEPNLRYLEDRIAKIKQVDTYTKTEIDNQHATIQSKIDKCSKKNESNVFTDIQSIKGNTAFLEFIDNSNTRRGWVGKGSTSSNDLSLNADTNSLLLSANHHIILNPGNNYQAKYNKNPTVNDEIVNKAYVDTKTAANKTYIDTKTDANKTILEQHDNRINGNWNVITENKTNINNLKDKTNANTTKLNSLETTINQNKDKINSLTTKVNTNIAEIEKQVRKITNLESNAAMKNTSNTFNENQIFSKNVNINNNLNVTNNIVSKSIESTNMYVNDVYQFNDKSVVNLKHLKDTLNNFQIGSRGYVGTGIMNVRIQKKAVSTPKSMFWYEFVTNQDINHNFFIKLKPNTRYAFTATITEIDSKQQVMLLHTSEWVTNDKDWDISKMILRNIFDGLTFVTWRDYFPGNEGVFSSQIKLKYAWVPL